MERSASFGDWLTQYRHSLHLQRAELAARIGCAAVTLRKIEIDERRPSRQMAEQLAEQLGIPEDQREVFVRVARGELSVDHLSLPRPGVAATNHLPHPTTSFAGREREVEEIQAMLSRPEVRLLTLTGAPGVGKTRLALEAAIRMQPSFPDGVFFVALAPLNDPELVLVTIAHTLQLGTSGKQPLVERLSRHLRTRRVLLLLDNFEHMLAVAPQLTLLLEAAPQLKLLVTSRIALELSGEHRLTVLPLGVPPDVENSQLSMTALQTQQRYSAVNLFIQRAQTVKPDLVLTEANLQKVSQICRRLDGLPLAIEFVAARCAFFTPQELLAQLDDRFALLTSRGRGRDLPVRHLTLWQALEWSYSLLSATDQRLFRRLGVFVGSFTLEAAQEVCNSDRAVGKNVMVAVTTLVASSLLERQEDYEESSRFKMLQTVREYALSQLTVSGETEMIRGQHAAYYLGLSQAAELAWDGPGEWNWLRRLVTLRDDLRAALRWALETQDATLALSLNAALFSFWTTCSALSEARSWVEAALALPSPDETPELLALKAKVLNVAGYVAAETADNAQAYSYFERGLALYRKLGNSRGISWSIRGCAFVQMQRDEYDAAGKLLNESLKLCESSQDGWGLAWSLYALAFLKLAQGDLPGAQTSLEDALVHLRRQNMIFGIFRALVALAYTMFEQGNVSGAEAFFREALLLNQKTPLLAIINAGLEGLAAVAAEKGRILQAAHLWGAAEAMREITGQRRLPVFERTYKRVLSAARSQSGTSDWERAWAAGRALTPAQALVAGLENEASTSISAELFGGTILPL